MYKVNLLVGTAQPNIIIPITDRYKPKGCGGKGFKALIGVAAAIAIPMAAPAIASSIGLSGAIAAASTATIGSAVGSAITGAAMGAISASVMGTDVEKAAMGGLIAGGLSGYMAAPSPTDSSAGAAGAVPNTSAGAGAGVGASTGGTAGVAQAEKATTFMGQMKAAGSEVANRVQNPDNMATFTLMAGATIMGKALAPDPDMSEEDKAILEQRKQELARLKAMDETAFNTQMEAAQQYLAQAKGYDPTAAGLQAANTERINQGHSLRAQIRSASMTGRGISEAEKRRMSLDASRNISTSFDRGYLTGLDKQTKVTEAGLKAIPRSADFTTYINQLRHLGTDASKLRTAAQERHDTEAKNIAGLFSVFNSKAGDEDEVKKKTPAKAGLVTAAGLTA